MFRSYPLFSRFSLFVLLPFLVVAVMLLRHFQASLPITSGQLNAAGLQDVVKLSRDKQGVLTINAKTDRDVYFAMGYAHAQDRLWQMELQRRTTKGRMSEAFGQKTVRQDIWFRTLGLYQRAEQAWPHLSKPAQDSLTAYAEGVNAWLASGHALPPEFVLLDMKPEKWSPIDSLAWSKVFALNLAGNFNQEIEHFVAAQTLNPEQMRSLYRAYPEQAPVTVESKKASVALAGLLQLQKEIERDLQIGGRFVGSNAWVVAGRLSEGGKPILANDPHMSLQLPSLWYAVRQVGATLDTQGMSLVGLPVVIFGKNQDIAWGGTNMMADVQDLYFEQINAQDPNQYLSGSQWKKFQARTEVIEVKADFPAFLREPYVPLKILVRESERGPIVSDIVTAFDQPVSLRWTALDQNDTTYESLYRMNYARDWPSFKAALAFHVAPALNMMYVDKANNIGYQGAGRIPIRAKGQGDYPVPGWGDEYRWKDFIAADAMPSSFNPERGFIVSANNKVVGADYPYFISNDWAAPARAQRIEQLLSKQVSSGKLFDMKTMQQMQGDLLNLEALQFLPRLTKVEAANEQQKTALQYLAKWDGQMAQDSPAASIYFAWMRHLRTQLFAQHLNGFWNREVQEGYLHSVAGNTSTDVMWQALTKDQSKWCKDATCDGALKTSLAQALSELEKLKGSNMEKWNWGSVHTTYFKHMPFSEVKIIDVLFTRKLASGGSPATLNAANANFDENKGYVQNFGAAFRQVIQMAENKHVFVNSTGQSGHPLSADFDNMVAPYGMLQYFNFGVAEQARANGELTLAPKK